MKSIVKQCIKNERKQNIWDAQDNCQQIINFNQTKYKNIVGLTYRMIDQLDIKNTLQFCAPRTEADRRHFQRFLE